MVLFPSDDQFELKSNELRLGSCWWSIPTFPKDQLELIGTPIYFYDKRRNAIVRRSHVEDFGYEMGKKVVYFDDLKPVDEDGNEYNEDEGFHLDLEMMDIPPRKQTRGWAYRWFPLEEELEKKEGS